MAQGASEWTRFLIRANQLLRTTTREGLGRPWDLLEQRLEEVRSEVLLLGTLYVLAGRRPPDGPG